MPSQYHLMIKMGFPVLCKDTGIYSSALAGRLDEWVELCVCVCVFFVYASKQNSHLQKTIRGVITAERVFAFFISKKVPLFLDEMLEEKDDIVIMRSGLGGG